MSNPFFDHPILNSPYEYPSRHWELDEDGQPTQKITEHRRSAKFITPIPKPKKRKKASAQEGFVFDEGKGLSTKEQQYDPTSVINEVRQNVDAWRDLRNPSQWQVSPETARLLQHWRHHNFGDRRPFFCQVEAVETAIWLTEVAPQSRSGKRLLDHLASANKDANPELMRFALKLATGAGKTTVMAMLIAWQTINAVRRPGSKHFTRGFLVVAPGLTIKDRLRVLQPNDPDTYYKDRELVPSDMLDEVNRAKIVITNFHAFKLRDRIELSKGGRQLLTGRTGDEPQTKETEGQMIQRVMPDLMGMKNILVLNDEAHHCYREKPDADEDDDLKGDERKEAEKNNEAARLWISGLEAVNRKLGLARVIDLSANFDETTGNPLPRPNTLLIDSEQLEAGDALDDNFRGMAADEIERFRREIIERSGDARSADNITDQELLREVMNTVGKPGQLGGSIRCVVSVSMLTEGWDANTVTHVLGIRAFGTQLLCEQVIGRALRRQSYELNEDGPDKGLFNVEYADVFGIPFDFTAKPVIAPPQPPRETVQVKAMRPERDALEIRFPRVEGYRVELPEERLSADFNDESILELNPDLVGPSITRNSGIIGEGVDMGLKHLGDMRPSTLVFHVTQRLLYTKWRDPGEEPKLHLFGQLKRITKQWLDTCLVCKGDTYPALLMYQELADMACNKITAAITRKFLGERLIKALLDAYNPTGSTRHVRFNTSRADRWETSSKSCHINWVVLDSDWEGEFCRVAESHPKVRAYVKNHNLGLEVPYRFGSTMRKYLPDFIVLVDDGHGPDDLLHLIVEIKGYRREDAVEKKSAMDTYWVPGVNHLGTYGRWAFAEFTEIYQIEADFKAKVKGEFDKLINNFIAGKG